MLKNNVFLKIFSLISDQWEKITTVVLCFEYIQTYHKERMFQSISSSLLDSVGEEEGGMIWENGIETCIISYMNRQSRFDP